MRLVCRFTKEERIKYISHLDLMRTMQRALRRSELPVAFTQGFNPHPRMAFASALPVGVTSEGEYMDIILEQPIQPMDFCQRMNRVLPRGMEITGAAGVSAKTPSLTSLIERAQYLIELELIEPLPGLRQLFEDFLEQPEIKAEKRGKKAARQVEIRRMIHRVDILTCHEKGISFNGLFSSGSRQNLNPELLIEAFLKFAADANPQKDRTRIHRKNMYLIRNGRWVTPLELG